MQLLQAEVSCDRNHDYITPFSYGHLLQLYAGVDPAALSVPFVSCSLFIEYSRRKPEPNMGGKGVTLLLLANIPFSIDNHQASAYVLGND